MHNTSMHCNTDFTYVVKYTHIFFQLKTQANNVIIPPIIPIASNAIVSASETAAAFCDI